MSVNLIDLAKNYLTSEIMGKLGGALGESPEHVEKAVGVGLPAILAGMLKKASSPSGAGGLSDMMKQEHPGLKEIGGLDGVLGNLGGLLEGSSMGPLLEYGKTILNALFGGNLNSILEMITKSSGMKSSSATSLLAMLAPMLMGLVKKHLGSQGLSASALTNLLMSQKDSIARLAPPGLSSALGLSSLSDLGGSAARAAADEGSALARWLLPLAGLAALLLAGFFLMRGTGEEPPMPAVSTQPPKPKPEADVGKTVDSSGRTLVETSRKLVPLALPGNAKLDVPEGSFLVGLVKSLENPTDATLPKTFILRGVTFGADGKTMSLESITTLEDIGIVLNAFKSAKVKIVAHTENTGDPAANKAKSLEQATAVKDALVRSGVSADRITAEGAGGDRPIASGDTSGDRAKNRRIELVIVTD